MDYIVGQRARVRPGRTVTVQAPARGRPTPNISWRLPSGRRLGVGERYGRYGVMSNGALQIRDARPSDTGTYRAIASSRAGDNVVDMSVQVVGMPTLCLQIVSSLVHFIAL